MVIFRITTASYTWIWLVDGASNLKRCGAGIVLEGSDDLFIEHSLKFKFNASKNKTEYEALIINKVLSLRWVLQVRRPIVTPNWWKIRLLGISVEGDPAHQISEKGA